MERGQRIRRCARVARKVVPLPCAFLKIPYDGARRPGSAASRKANGGANCQRFVYELLTHFGKEIPEFRSSELWKDRKHTTVAKNMRPLDIVLFNRTRNAWGAHLGLYLGNGKVIHLSKAVGQPAVWNLEEFAEHERYRVVIGAKRIKPRRKQRG